MNATNLKRVAKSLAGLLGRDVIVDANSLVVAFDGRVGYVVGPDGPHWSAWVFQREFKMRTGSFCAVVPCYGADERKALTDREFAVMIAHAIGMFETLAIIIAKPR